MKILVIQQKRIGDVLTATIILEVLRKEYPRAQIHYLINTHTTPVIENNPDIDKVILFTPEMRNNYFKFYRLLKSLKTANYDVVIDAYGKIGSLLMSYFSKAEKRIGYYKNYTSFFYTDCIKKSNALSAVSLAIENRLKLLEPLQISVKKKTPKLYLTDGEKEKAKNKLIRHQINLEKPLLMVQVLGSEKRKTYPGKYMAVLIDYCIEINPDLQILFNYMPKQKKQAKAIYTQTKKNTKKNIYLNIFGKSLREFMALTFHCQASFGNEGGGNNIAKALGVPTFKIFSPEIPKNYWYSLSEKPKHRAFHLSDIPQFSQYNKKQVQKNIAEFYSEMKPDLLKEDLRHFILKWTLQL